MPTRQITALIVPMDGGDPRATIKAIDTALRGHPGDHTILVVSPEDSPASEIAVAKEVSATKDSAKPTKDMATTAASDSPTSASQTHLVPQTRIIWEQHPALYPLRLIAGWRLAIKQQSDLIFTTDDSWRPSPAEVTKFLDIYESGARIVAGRRPETSLQTTLRRKWTKFKSRSRLSDPSSPIRLYDRKALKTILQNLPPNRPPSKTKHPTPRTNPSQTPHRLQAQTIPTLERQSGFATKETPATLVT